MNRLKIKLENCYGIKKLEHEFDFSDFKTFAIYAPNGVMKTSFSRVFKDLMSGKVSQDLMFANRKPICEIKDENNRDITREQVFVIDSYDEYFKSDKISNLIANKNLRERDEEARKKINEAKEIFLKKIKKLSGLSGDIEKEISERFSGKNFFDILMEQEKVISKGDDPKFAKVIYKLIFNNTALKLLQEGDFKKQIKEYIEKYNELLNKSLYFRKGFNHYNAIKVQKSLSGEGFFKVKHSVNLFNGAKDEKVTSASEFEKIISDEKEKILSNIDLQEKFKKIDDRIKNKDLEDLREYLQENQEILPELEDLDKFSREIWISYFISQKDLYNLLLEEYKKNKSELEEISKLARKEQGDWAKVIDEFNRRFSTSCKLMIGNQEDVILRGEDNVFIYEFEDPDTKERIIKEKEEIIDVLSRGEKKALYLLNIIFEVEARKKIGQKTLFIIDDIADSFDYKNKYAIIQYLKENSENLLFRQIILTHNFDFYRTIQGRVLDTKKWDNSFIAQREVGGIKLLRGGDKDVIAPFDKWKKGLNVDSKMLVASIPFIRNLIEFKEGHSDNYNILNSLLHIKENSHLIVIKQILVPFSETLKDIDFKSYGSEVLVLDLIFKEAEEISGVSEPEDSINLENKIILSMGIRLKAEEFMWSKVTNREEFTENQTGKLFQRYKDEFRENGLEKENIEIMEAVNIMTPENIHLNSFMYEPILDMSDQHLRSLYQKVKGLI